MKRISEYDTTELTERTGESFPKDHVNDVRKVARLLALYNCQTIVGTGYLKLKLDAWSRGKLPQHECEKLLRQYAFSLPRSLRLEGTVTECLNYIIDNCYIHTNVHQSIANNEICQSKHKRRLVDMWAIWGR